MRHTQRKLMTFYIGMLALVAWSGAPVAAQDAGEISATAVLANVRALPTTNLVQAESYYTVALTPVTSGMIKAVETTYPAGFNLANAKLIEVSGIGSGTLLVAGQSVVYTVTTPEVIVSGQPIMVMVGGIVNGTSLSNQVTVTTKDAANGVIDGPTVSAAFTLTKVKAAMLNTNAVNSSKIVDGSVASADLALGAVGAAQINPTQVQRRVTGACAAGSSISAVSADGLVACEPDDGVNFTAGTGIAIVGSTIGLATGGVGSAQIADGTVGGADLAAGAVGSAQLGDGAVSGAKILDNTITDTDIQDRLVSIYIPAHALGSSGPVTRGLFGLSFSATYVARATGMVGLPKDWDGVSSFTIDLHFTPDTNGTGTASFFIRPTGRAVGEVLSDPGGLGSSGVFVPLNSSSTLFIQRFTVPSVRVSTGDDFFHLYAIQRGGTGETFADTVTLLGVRISYTAKR